MRYLGILLGICGVLFGQASIVGGKNVQVAEYECNAACMATFDSSNPLALVPAPGTGKYVVLLSPFVVSYTFGTQAYVNNDESISIRYADHDEDLVAPTNLEGQLQAGSSQIRLYTWGSYPAANSIYPAENKAVLLRTAGATGFRYGPIATSEVEAGGTGWAADDTFTLDAADAGTETCTVTAVSGGAVTAYTCDGAGTHHVGVSNTTPGTCASMSCAGLQIDVTAINAGDGTVKFSIAYYITNL